MKEDPTIAASLVSFAATILAYTLLFNLPIMIATKPIQVFISASCSTLAVVVLFRVMRSGPLWARILTGLIMLPLLIEDLFRWHDGNAYDVEIVDYH